MYLKALKLHGFKSFADPTTLAFQPGVTAVVGPNGCGKSNIADAIRWVLGEQSAKALRGGRMQDVIFEGTDRRKPVNLCEVSMLLTECEQQLGSEFHEIEISRRVTRDGQGEYFLNGQACRLKDIHRLFMDTGVGRTSYSIMAQGQIDLILSSKPEERRSVFEEAAGITRYKSQRREAMNKLVQVEANLARVADVIGEVGRQIGSLRRQAAKAMRYKRFSLRLRRLSLAADGRQYRLIRETLGDLERQFEALRSDVAERRSELEKVQAGVDSKKSRRSELHQRLQEAQQSVYDVKSQMEQAENRSHLAGIKRGGLEERIKSSRDNLGEIEMQLREVADQADSGAHDKQQQLSLLGTSDAEFQNRNRDLGIIEGELSKAESELQNSKLRLLEAESAVTRLRAETSALEVDQKTSRARHDAMLEEIEAARTTLSEADSRVEAMERETSEARQSQDEARHAAAAAQEALASNTAEYREAQGRLQEIDRGLAQRTARLRLLQQLQEKWEGFGEGARAVLQGKLSDIVDPSSVHPITSDLDVAPETARALEALLGSAVEALAVADLDVARRVLARLEEGRIGSICLHLKREATPDPAPVDLPAFLRPASTVVGDTASGRALRSLLTDCYLADSLEAFLDYWGEHPEFSFLLVATPRGELVDRRGLVCGGHKSGDANGILQREADLRETTREVERAQAAHERQRAVVDELNRRLLNAEQELEGRRRRILEATERVSAAQTDERNARQARDAAGQRLAKLEQEIGALEQAAREAEERHARALTGLEKASSATDELRAEVQRIELSLSEMRVRRDEKKELLAQARLELAERRQKVEILDRGLSEMERRRIQLEDLLEQRRGEIEAWTAQIEELEREAEDEKKRAEELSRTLAIARESTEKVRGEVVSIETGIGEYEERLGVLRRETERADQEAHQVEVRLTEQRSRLRFLQEEAQREFQADLAEVDWKWELWYADDEPADIKPLDLDEEESGDGDSASSEDRPDEPAATEGERASQPAATVRKKRGRSERPKVRPDPSPEELAALDSTDWEQIQAEINALRQRIQNMGAVNLVAIEEYSELKQRYEFLKSQSDDLTTSKERLLKAIDDINRTSLVQFEATFEQIRKNFIFTFETLFGGGHADLRLQEAEDILESGIDIVAQPPGTKLKSITLLSGGQRALTAVALLFALYMVKPSPFCLLDELDAPLDESNVGRFTKLLRQFTASSQFVIITHNKRTVAAADAIYGVTMEERGVSKTVSMRFNRETDEPEEEVGTKLEEVQNTVGAGI